MTKFIIIISLCLFSSSLFAGSDYDGPQTLQEYKARTLRRVAWAEKKVKKPGRIDAVSLFNKFDKTADVNDYVIAYVFNDGKNDHFVLASKIRKIVFTNFYNHPNHVIMRAAYKKIQMAHGLNIQTQLKKTRKNMFI